MFNRNLFLIVIFFSFCFAENGNSKKIIPIYFEHQVTLNQTINNVNNSSSQTSSERVIPQSQVMHLGSSWLSRALTHKWILLGGSIGAMYGYVYSYLLLKGWRIQKKEGWHTWHDSVPVAALRELPPKQVIEELQYSLKGYYKCDTVSVDIIISCLIDIEKESSDLESFIAKHQAIDAIKLSFLFPQQDQLQSIVCDKLERLAFIKNMLITHTNLISKKVTEDKSVSLSV